MKATKIFMMAALALTFAACSNDDNDFAQQPAAQPANGEITITATVSSDDATTRALSVNGSNIASTWETTDQFAILFNDGSNNVKRTATVQSINGSNVTITFTIPESLANNTACTIVYPASAANAANTGVDVATALATQDGTIDNCPEVRVGTATIDKSTHSLSDVTKLAAQNAIFKFTVKNSDASATINVKPLTITIGAQDYVITPASATSELFVALPPIASQAVIFSATGSDSKTYTASKASVTFVAGKYYQSNINMTEVPAAKAAAEATAEDKGKLIGTDGKIYADVAAATAAGTTAVAKIIYIGATGHGTYTHGLALALTDEGQMAWEAAKTACNTTKNTSTPVTDATWLLASKAQWNYMMGINGAGSDTALREGFSGITGASDLQSGVYWSSTQYDAGNAWFYGFGYQEWARYDKGSVNVYVRACLAF